MKRKGNNLSVLYRYIFSYIVIICMFILIYGIFLYGRAVNNFKSEIQATSLNKIRLVADDFDAQIKTMSMISAEISQNRKFKKTVLHSSVLKEVELIEEIMKYQQKIQVNLNCIFYYRNNNVFYTADGKYLPEVYFSNVLKIDEKEFFLKTIDHGEIPEIAAYSGIESGTQKFVILTYPISTNNAFYPDATVIFILDNKSIRQRMNDIVGVLPGVVSFYQEESLLFTSSIENNHTLREYFLNFHDENQFKEIKVGKEKYNFFRVDTSAKALTYYYAMPHENNLIYKSDLWKDIGFGVSIILIVGLFTAILLSYYNYKPIKALLNFIQQLHIDNINTDKTNNEFRSIENTLKNVFDTNMHLSSRLERQSKTLKDQMLINILKNGLQGNILSKQDNSNLKFEGPYYFVAIARMNTENFRLYASRLQEILDAGNTFRNKPYYYVFSDVENILVFIFNVDDGNLETRSVFLQDMIQLFRDANIPANFGAGQSQKDASKINSSYYEASAALDQNRSAEDLNVVYFEEIVEKHSHFSWYPSEEVILYLQTLKQGDEKMSIDNLMRVYDEIRKRSLSQLMEHYICYDIVNTFVKTMNQLNIQIDPLELNVLASYTNIDELFRKLVDLTVKACSSIRESTGKNDRKIVNKIIQYLKEHIYEYDISLNKVADVFNIPTYHISRIFKETNGIGFKEYVVGIKMEKAKNLLKDSVSVTEISEMMGYTSLSNFIRSFKAVEGITPAQYRKLLDANSKLQ